MVVNDASAMSVAIGEAYRRLRGVPAQNVVHLQVPLGDDAALRSPAHERIDRAGYTARVRDPIARFLRENDPRRADPDPRHDQGRAAARRRRSARRATDRAPHRRGRRRARGAVLAARRPRGNRGRRQPLLPLEPAVRRVAQPLPGCAAALSRGAHHRLSGCAGSEDGRAARRRRAALARGGARLRRHLGDRREPAPVDRLPRGQRRDAAPRGRGIGCARSGAAARHRARIRLRRRRDRGLRILGEQRREPPSRAVLRRDRGPPGPGPFRAALDRRHDRLHRRAHLHPPARAVWPVARRRPDPRRCRRGRGARRRAAALRRDAADAAGRLRARGARGRGLLPQRALSLVDERLRRRSADADRAAVQARRRHGRRRRPRSARRLPRAAERRSARRRPRRLRRPLRRRLRPGRRRRDLRRDPLRARRAHGERASRAPISTATARSTIATARYSTSGSATPPAPAAAASLGARHGQP